VIQNRTVEQQTLDALLRVLIVGGAVVVLVAVAFGAILRAARAGSDPRVA
jgi:hypothetical protein